MGNQNSKIFIKEKIASDFFEIHKLQRFLNLCFFKLP